MHLLSYFRNDSHQVRGEASVGFIGVSCSVQKFLERTSLDMIDEGQIHEE